jgi:hypothetical protein
MNTAKMREKARFYETKLDWANAALCWESASRYLPSTVRRFTRRSKKNRPKAVEWVGLWPDWLPAVSRSVSEQRKAFIGLTRNRR